MGLDIIDTIIVNSFYYYYWIVVWATKHSMLAKGFKFQYGSFLPTTLSHV